MVNELKYVLDPIHGSISITKLEERIIESTLFNRLNYITQLSTVFFIYPSANHVRSSHSIGTMYLASKYFTNAMNNASTGIQNEFLIEFGSVIEDIIKHERAKDYRYTSQEDLPHRIESLFQGLRNFNLNSISPTIEEIKYFYYLLQSVRIAALLHDVGHLPFSHLAETSLDSVYNLIKDKESQKDMEIEFCELYEQYIAGCDPLHETLGNKIIDLIFWEIEQEDQFDREELVHIKTIQKLTKNIVTNTKSDRIDFTILHNIISSMVDVDRLDYVKRDILGIGAKVNSFDIEDIILNTVLIKKDESFVIGLRVSAIENVERFLLSRFHLYNSFLFSAQAIKKYQVLNQVLIRSCVRFLKDNKKQTNNKEYRLPLDISGLWIPLYVIKGSYTNKYDAIDILFQYDENWLLYILKMEYFEIEREYYQDENNFGNRPRTRKHFFGLREILFGESLFVPLWDSKNSFATFFGMEQRDVSRLTRSFLLAKNKKILTTFFKELINKYQELDIFFAIRQFKNGYDNDFVLIDKSMEMISIADMSPIRDILLELTYSEAPFYFYMREIENREVQRQQFELELKNRIRDIINMKEVKEYV